MQIQEAIIGQLRKSEACRPTELLEALLRQGFTEAEVREAVAQLLSEKRVELTTQRMLKLSNQAAA